MLNYDLIDRGILAEDSPHCFTTFASDLYDAVPEMRRGFPRLIDTGMGNKQPFVLERFERDQEGDILVACYRQDLGCCRLHVFND